MTNVTLGLETAATAPPSANPTAGKSAPTASTTPIKRAWRSDGVLFLDGGNDAQSTASRSPVPPTNENTHATHSAEDAAMPR